MDACLWTTLPIELHVLILNFLDDRWGMLRVVSPDWKQLIDTFFLSRQSHYRHQNNPKKYNHCTYKSIVFESNNLFAWATNRFYNNVHITETTKVNALKRDQHSQQRLFTKDNMDLLFYSTPTSFISDNNNNSLGTMCAETLTQAILSDRFDVFKRLLELNHNEWPFITAYYYVPKHINIFTSGKIHLKHYYPNWTADILHAIALQSTNECAFHWLTCNIRLFCEDVECCKKQTNDNGFFNNDDNDIDTNDDTSTSDIVKDNLFLEALRGASMMHCKRHINGDAMIRCMERFRSISPSFLYYLGIYDDVDCHINASQREHFIQLVTNGTIANHTKRNKKNNVNNNVKRGKRTIHYKDMLSINNRTRPIPFDRNSMFHYLVKIYDNYEGEDPDDIYHDSIISVYIDFVIETRDLEKLSDLVLLFSTLMLTKKCGNDYWGCREWMATTIKECCKANWIGAFYNVLLPWAGGCYHYNAHHSNPYNYNYNITGNDDSVNRQLYRILKADKQYVSERVYIHSNNQHHYCITMEFLKYWISPTMVSSLSSLSLLEQCDCFDLMKELISVEKMMNMVFIRGNTEMLYMLKNHLNECNPVEQQKPTDDWDQYLRDCNTPTIEWIVDNAIHWLFDDTLIQRVKQLLNDADFKRRFCSKDSPLLLRRRSLYLFVQSATHTNGLNVLSEMCLEKPKYIGGDRDDYDYYREDVILLPWIIKDVLKITSTFNIDDIKCDNMRLSTLLLPHIWEYFERPTESPTAKQRKKRKKGLVRWWLWWWTMDQVEHTVDVFDFLWSKGVRFDHETTIGKEEVWRRADDINALLWLSDHGYPCTMVSSVLRIVMRLFLKDRFDLLYRFLIPQQNNSNSNDNDTSNTVHQHKEYTYRETDRSRFNKVLTRVLQRGTTHHLTVLVRVGIIDTQYLFSATQEHSASCSLFHPSSQLTIKGTYYEIKCGFRLTEHQKTILSAAQNSRTELDLLISSQLHLFKLFLMSK